MKKLGHQGDRLSELPPSLIHHILSFLPLKDVVSTTILSKRWENLWTTAPCLNLKIDCEIENEYSGSGTEDEEDVDEVKSVERLLKFVNRALIVWKGVKILKFKIDIKYDYMMSLDSDVTVWTRFAVNKEVEELEIITAGEHIAPKCLNSCSSLTKLSLECCNVEMLNSPSWNQLKSLRLDVFSGSPISGDLIDQILLGSPELEVFELHLEYNNEDLNIRSTSLKKLKIENRLHLQRDIQPKATLRICCPHLDTLEISGLFGKCLFSDVSSLIDITLHIRNFPSLACSVGETLKQIFSTIQHAENVSLSDLCVEVFGASHKKYLHSPLPNVKFLKLDLRHIQSGEMMNLFGIFPNLKMLVIKHEVLVLRKSPDSDVVTNMEFESNFLLELKTVEISSNFYDLSIFWFIEFLLKHAVKLEMMVLRSTAFASNRQKVFEISEKLLNMQRSSPTAKVVLKNK